MTLNDIAYWLTIKPRLNRLKRLLPEAVILPAGSRYVCNPPVMTTDIDFLIYTEKLAEAVLELVMSGYKESNFKHYRDSGEPNKPIACFRRGKINVILTANPGYFRDFETATHICKRYNVRYKLARVTVYEALRKAFDKSHDFWELAGMPELQQLVLNFCGPHGAAYHKVYRLQHGLDKETE